MDRILGFDQQFLTETVFLIFNVLILFGVLTYLLFNPVRQYMAKRAERIKNDIEQAESEKAKALEMKKEYEEKLRDIKQQADQILRDARKSAMEKEQQIIKKAKEEADHIHERAQVDIAREQERVKDELKQQMIEVASLMAGKFVASTMDETTQERLIQETIQEMGDVKWLN